MKTLLLILIAGSMLMAHPANLYPSKPDNRDPGTCMQPPKPMPPKGCTGSNAVLLCNPGCECSWTFEDCSYDYYKEMKKENK